MSTRIRLARGGTKKKPFYRLVIADKRAPRDGNFVEKLGTYNPMLAKDDAQRFLFDSERLTYWINNGATPTERVAILLFNADYAVAEKFLPTAYPKDKAKLDELRQARAAKAAEKLKAKTAATEQADAAAADAQEKQSDSA